MSESRGRLSSQMDQSTTKSINAMPSQSKTSSRTKVRKSSYGFGTVPGIRPMERVSLSGTEYRRPPHLYLPTFQVRTYYMFQVPKVQTYVENLADEFFSEHVYSAQISPQLALRFAAEVTRTVRTMNFNRYRIITVACIGERRSQSYNNAVTFLWDEDCDRYIDVHRERHTAFLQITVFGIYLD